MIFRYVYEVLFCIFIYKFVMGWFKGKMNNCGFVVNGFVLFFFIDLFLVFFFGIYGFMWFVWGGFLSF